VRISSEANCAASRESVSEQVTKILARKDSVLELNDGSLHNTSSIYYGWMQLMYMDGGASRLASRDKTLTVSSRH
jgi:hypothetical protein